MDKQHQRHRSHLFTVRIWQEELYDGQTEWRGKLQHVHSREALYFREWPALVAGFLKMLTESGSHPEQD